MTEVRQCVCGDLDCVKWMRWQEAEGTDYPWSEEEHRAKQTPWWWPFPSGWWRW